MSDSVFPRPASGPTHQRDRVEQVLRRAPLSAIRELLGSSIHDAINERQTRRLVVELYRVTRWIDNECWLRRSVAALESGESTRDQNSLP